MKDLTDIPLPKINQRKAESSQMQLALKNALLDTVKKFEEETNYEFVSFELDNVLLEIISSHHRSYLNTHFGYDTV